MTSSPWAHKRKSTQKPFLISECKGNHINSITALFSIVCQLLSTNFYYFLPISTTQCFQTRKIPFTDASLRIHEGDFPLPLISQPLNPKLYPYFR